MMYVELISLIGGALSGFLFKLIAQSQSDKQAIFERLIRERQAGDQSADRAANRDDSKAGQYTRRFIVVSVLFGLIMAPFILSLLNLPIIVQTDTPFRSWLAGIVQTGGISKFYEINGYLLSPTLTSCATAIVGFYFGTAAGKRE